MWFSDFISKPYGVLITVGVALAILIALSFIFYRCFFKRFYDVILSFLALTVLSPILIVLTVIGAIKMKGNPFFTQQRPGRINKKTGQERIFRLIKFRTMTNERDENGNLQQIVVDGVQITEIRSKDLYVGSISSLECDRLSYVAVYKMSTLSRVGVYTASDLDQSPIKLEDGNYYLVVADRSGNHYTVTAKVSSTLLDCKVTKSTDKYIKLTCNRRADQIL